MIFFWKLVVGLSFVLIIFLTATVFIARQTPIDPPDLDSFGLSLCYGSPCFRGIRPGHTAWNNAIGLTEPYPGGENETNIIIMELPERAMITMYPAGTELNRVGLVQLDMESRTNQIIKLPFYALIQKYGFPCEIGAFYSFNNRTSMRLTYPQMTAYIGLKNNRIEMESPVVLLNLVNQVSGFSGDINQCLGINFSSRRGTSAWLGFASLRRYSSVWR